MIEAIQEVTDHELKEQIVQTLMQIPELPSALLKTMYASSYRLTIDKKTPVSQIVEILRNTMHTLDNLIQRAHPEELVPILGQQLIETGFPEKIEGRGFIEKPPFK